MHGGENCGTVKDGYAPSGTDGWSGVDVPPESAPKPGTDGDDEAPSVAVVNAATLGAARVSAQVRMVLTEAETAYYAEQQDRAAKLLLWLAALTGGMPGTAAPVVVDILTPVPMVLRPTAAEWQALRERVLDLLRQMQLGQDYYGSLPNQVQLVDFASYKQDMDQLLRLAEQTAAAHGDYWASAENREAARQSLRASSTQAQRLAGELKVRASFLRTQREATSQQVLALLAQAEQQKVALQTARAELQAAVAHGQECGLGELLQVVSTIVSASGSLYTGLLGVADALSAWSSPPKSAKERVEIVKTIGRNVETIGKGWNDIRDALRERPNSAVIAVPADDWTRITEDQLKEIDKLVDRGGDQEFVDAARRFKADLRQFRELSRAASDKRMEEAALLNTLDGITSDLRQLENHAQRVASVIAEETFEPAVGELVAFVTGSWQTMRRTLLHLFYDAERALEYLGIVDLEPLTVGRATTDCATRGLSSSAGTRLSGSRRTDAHSRCHHGR